MENRQSESGRAQPPAIMALGGYLIGPLFLLLAAWFLFAPAATSLPVAPTPQFALSEIAVAPMREPLADPPTIEIAGFMQRCNACHSLFESSWDGERPLVQHTHVSLAHGINDNCFNCHDRDDRERLTSRSGETFGYQEVATLCRQCHGPIYRDWTRGVHGKTLGFWNTDAGEQRRLTCSACHDPHAPAYPSFAPLPGPNTLRMGEQGDSAHAEAPPESNPLRKWRQRESEDSHAEDSHAEDGDDH